jgi:MoxR-like ATPase
MSGARDTLRRQSPEATNEADERRYQLPDPDADSNVRPDHPASEEETRMTTTTHPTTSSPLEVQDVSAWFDPTDVQARIVAAINEMRLDLFERDDLIHNMWVVRVGGLHHIQIGPGGIAKTYAIRRMTHHVEGDIYYENTLDETSDPSVLYGPPNVKAMVEDGRTTFVTEGQLPEATVAMIDEVFNGNTPILHSMQPVLNERVFPNGGKTMPIPLRSCFMGSNWENPDVALAWFWDRIHVRDIVGDIQERENLRAMVTAAILRTAAVGRGTATVMPGQKLTTVTLAELDQARVAALALPVTEAADELFYDIRDEIQFGKAGARVSPRRLAESMIAVKANAWVRGHDEVKVDDLDILASMWWTVQEQRAEVRNVVLTATNPSEKAALDLLEDLDAVKEEIALASKPEVDAAHKTRIAVEQIRAVDKLIGDAEQHLADAQAAGLSTRKIEEVVERANATKVQIGSDFFGLDAATQARMAASA